VLERIKSQSQTQKDCFKKLCGNFLRKGEEGKLFLDIYTRARVSIWTDMKLLMENTDVNPFMIIFIGFFSA